MAASVIAAASIRDLRESIVRLRASEPDVFRVWRSKQSGDARAFMEQHDSVLDRVERMLEELLDSALLIVA